MTTNASSTVSTINGTLSLGGLTTTFTVAAGTVPGGVDLAIPASIVTGGIVKAGGGMLSLSNANS